MKNKKIAFIVFTVPPQERKYHWWPCFRGEDGVLFLANLNGRKDGAVKPTVFKLRKDANKAIRASRRYMRQNDTLWTGLYLIQAIDI